jgi:hypothetical protein
VVKATRLGQTTLDKSWSYRLGVCREASSLTQEKYLLKKAQQGNAGRITLGRPRHVKRIKKELLGTYAIGRKWHRIEIVGRKRLSKPEPYIGCSAL